MMKRWTTLHLVAASVVPLTLTCAAMLLMPWHVVAADYEAEQSEHDESFSDPYRLAATELVSSMLKSKVFDLRVEGDLPHIVITSITNRTPYQFQEAKFVGWFETELVKSGKATFSSAYGISGPGGRSGDFYKMRDLRRAALESQGADDASSKVGRVRVPDYELYAAIYTLDSPDPGSDFALIIEMSLSDIRTGVAAWKDMKRFRFEHSTR